MASVRKIKQPDDFFGGSPDELSHPRLEEWKERKKAGATGTLELYRPPVAVGLSRTKMFVRFKQDGVQQPADEVDWDEHLNHGLIQLGVPAVNSDQEAERFALALRDGLRTVEKEFGNGYFNAVLLDLVVESKLDQYPEIAEVLRFTYHDQTEKTAAYHSCRDAIALGVSARAKELEKALGYPREQARTILAGAIARYLDERFSVTARRHLGLLS